MTEPAVLIESTPEGVTTVTLNSPSTRNAFDSDIIEGLNEAFEDLHGADGVRVVFLRGAGSMFCAGANLQWMAHAAGMTEHDNHEDAMALARMLKALWDTPALTVALIQGGAYGGGAGLAAACDLAIAAPDAKFAFSEARLGLVAGAISPYVVRAIGPRHARALFATARVFDAAHAERIGLVTEVAEDLDAAAARIAEDIRACAPGAVAESKQLVDAVFGRPIDHDVMEDTARRIARARVGDEGQEGVSAFLARRKPSWAKPGA